MGEESDNESEGRGKEAAGRGERRSGAGGTARGGAPGGAGEPCPEAMSVEEAVQRPSGEDNVTR